MGEIYEALEKIKAEGSDSNQSLRPLIFEAKEESVQIVSKKGVTKMETG
jgi:hypothetical protein